MICTTDCLPFVSLLWWNKSCCGSHFTAFHRCVTIYNTIHHILFFTNRYCFSKKASLSALNLHSVQRPTPFALGTVSTHSSGLLSLPPACFPPPKHPFDDVRHIFCLVFRAEVPAYEQHPLFFTCLHPRAPPQLSRCPWALRSTDVIC